jgi:hypothetical protein
MLDECNEFHKRATDEARSLQPLAFFKPSYDQAILLNAWMYGIAFLCVYSANRIGKTTAMIINILLWILPVPHTYRIFAPYRVGDKQLDPENQSNPRKGQLVQVFPRPDISALKKIKDALARKPAHLAPPNPRKPHYDPDNQAILQWLQTQVPEAYVPADTTPNSPRARAPWNTSGVIWFGAPDQEHHEKVMLPLWKQYLPSPSVKRYVTSERTIVIETQSTHPSQQQNTWELLGKSYESKDTKWSSGAVDIIMLTEGVTPATLKEVKMRFKDPGIGSHDYTPYLPANSGPAAALAQKIAKGKEILPLSYFVFTELSVYDAPSHIISKDKKDGLIASYQNDPEGQARLEGKFYASSMLILGNLNKDTCCLPWSRDELFQRYPTAQLYRGIDPGLDHPTACAWAALLPTGQLVFYRFMSEPRLTISQRAKRIIELSGNTRSRVRYGKGDQDHYWIETHNKPESEIYSATYIDYHIFKEDETTGQPYSLNYVTEGLPIIESHHIKPEQRVQLLDGMLAPSPFMPHLLTNKPPGPKVYFLINEPGVAAALAIWDELYWERLLAGPDKGQPKDSIPSHGDDELDAATYISCAPIRWTGHRPHARLPQDSEPEEELIHAARMLSKRRPGSPPMPKPQFATNAKQSNRQLSYFGAPPEESEDEDY